MARALTGEEDEDVVCPDAHADVDAGEAEEGEERDAKKRDKDAVGKDE